jgi:EAL domain-containing protein (putative c-di-GMP-specific phosphodiesterase class I)
VSAIINIGKSLNRVVAEGFESEEQRLTFVASQHCAERQGYLFIRP